jgi:hypothetical protein
MSRRGKFIEIDSKQAVVRDWRSKEWGVAGNEQGFLLKSFRKWNNGDIVQLCKYSKTHKILHFKMMKIVNYMYVNFISIKKHLVGSSGKFGESKNK